MRLKKGKCMSIDGNNISTIVSSIKFFWICLFFSVVILASYWQVKNFAFVNFDDNLYVQDNQYVQEGLTLQNIKWAFTDATRVTNFWAPLTWLSIIMDYELYGMNAGGYHVTNLLFHIANSLLLFFLFFKMTGTIWQSFFVAIMFALHPLHVESVAWVTERKDVLSTLFWFLTMWAYISYTESPNAVSYIASLCFFILGLMSKPMLVTLPFVMLLLDFWPLKRIQFQLSDKIFFSYKLFQLLREKSLFFILVVIFSAAAFFTQEQGKVLPSISQISLLLRAENVIVSYASYLWQMVWPFNLAVAYPYPHYQLFLQVMISLFLIGSISIFSVYLGGKKPYLIVGWLWYIGTLIPVIGIVVIANQAMADRYTYVPLIGIFVMIAWGIPDLLKNMANKNNVIITIVLCHLILITVLTINQIHYWKDSKTLFHHTLKVTSNNAIAHNNYGSALRGSNNLDGALLHFLEAQQIDPKMALTYNNIGMIMADRGDMDKAIQNYSMAVRLDSNFSAAYNNWGIMLFEQNKLQEAAELFQEALRVNPDHADYQKNYNTVLKKQKMIDSAIRQIEKNIKYEPANPILYYQLGSMYLKKGESKAAISNFKQALLIKPDFHQAKKTLERINLSEY
jgi:protein O-mannosyl-transferase